MLFSASSHRLVGVRVCLTDNGSGFRPRRRFVRIEGPVEPAELDKTDRSKLGCSGSKALACVIRDMKGYAGT